MGLNRCLAAPRLVHLAIILLFLTAGCARYVPMPRPFPDEIPDQAVPPGSLFDADHRQISLAEMAQRARLADYFLIGESHDNSCDHQFQADALAALERAGRTPGLGLEMVPWSRQHVLDAFNQGELSADALANDLDWAGYWGYSFDLYRPILELAHGLGIPVIALNAPKDLQDMIRTQGLEGVPDDQTGLLPPEIILPAPAQLKLLEEEYLRHVRMAQSHDQPEPFDLERFLLIQSLWDTQMAYAAAAWRRANNRPMVILAGAGHVDHGHGIARRLAILDDNPRILSVSPWRGGRPWDPATADMFFYCPEAPPSRLGLIIAWEEDRAVITAVLPASRAEKAGLKVGDVLLSAGGAPVENLAVLHQAGMAAASTNNPLLLKILRGETAMEVEVAFIN